MIAAIQEQNIPSMMKSSPHWILWKLEGQTPDFKGTKIPYSAKNPYKKASSTNPYTWGMFGEVLPLAHLHDMSGVGYVFTEEMGIVAIDIDGCIVNGIPTDIGNDVLSLFSGKTYIEISQSGTGYHILAKGTLKAKSFTGIEVYTSGRYFAMTGNIVGGCNAINTTQPELDILCNVYGREIPITPINWNPQPQQKNNDNINFISDLNLRVQDIGYPGNAKQTSADEIRGSHPFHGSTTGLNYAINTNKNVWICRRDGHNSGGGPLELFAVRESIIRCEDARPGCLDGKWKEMISALKKCGYAIPDKKKPSQQNVNAINANDIRCTDFGNAYRFLNKYSNDIVYCKTQNNWYLWNSDKGIWELDTLLRVREYTKQIFRDIYIEAEHHPTPEGRTTLARWAITCEKPEHINSCLNVAQSDGRVIVSPDKFDTDKYLFNLLNGTYDLRTHELLPHDKQNYITKCVGIEYDKTAKCPRFLKFIDRIFKSRKDKAQIIEYLQKALGYSLTGEISQQSVFLLYGSGANGKSTLIETQRMVMGDYGTTIDSSSLTTKKSDGVRNDIARLPSVRFVSASENAKGTVLDEELVKKLSGGDQVTARFLFQEEFQFYPQLKLWWAFNHPPGLNDFTHSLMRRLKLIPFEEVIDGAEKIDQAILLGWHKEELAGIFNWELEGLKKFQSEGLKDIPAVTNAVKEFKEEQDRLHEFIQDKCYVSGVDGVPEQDMVTSATILCKMFNEWADQNNEKQMSQRKFSMEMKERGFKRVHTNKGNVFHGISKK
jgi:putative DNA primase/helicase